MPHHSHRRRLWRDLQGTAGCQVRYTDRSRRVDSQTTRESQGLIMPRVDQLKVKIFADGADRTGMLEMYKNPHVKGFTTNPTLMRKAGVTDYEAAAKDILAAISDRSISFEVFADDFSEMERQARRMTTWGKHVSVEIPLTNTEQGSATPLV